MDIRTRACFTLSRHLMVPPAERTVDYGAYGDWRVDSLSRSWKAFPDSCITGKDVLDFGCGDGQLSLYLAKEKRPRRIVGVDINDQAIERARESLVKTPIIDKVDVEFMLGSNDQLPLPDQSFDTLVAFDCMEHVMSPAPILCDWHRILRPGGRCLIEWFPYKGPWGPHMEALIPIPWAHMIFGERAMFRAAEMIYDLPEFIPRHWDLNENGNKKANKWRAWSSFEEQGYINKLNISEFRIMAHDAGFQIARHEIHSFGGSKIRKAIGYLLAGMPVVGEYFVSYITIELQRPSDISI